VKSYGKVDRLYHELFLFEEDVMRLFNTLTNKKEEFKPIEEGKVSIYICGPTVYNHAHIGNTRPMIVFDVLRRTFEYLGNDVTFVSNYTDVDDKIIKAAKAEGITEKELTDKYIKAYEDVRAGLNIEDPTYKPRVTETMPEIINFIQALIDKGYAYEVDGDVYFRVTKVKEYGMLSGIKVEDLIAGASDRTLSVDDKKKESTTDFALWKKTDEGIQFDTPWSKGRPGWHTECVVMINKLFKDGKIDIHGGGQDLKFPHHENEIAQSMAYNGHPIANYWMHNQMINIDGEKMSKSLGNVLWAKDLIVEFGCNVFKWLMLSTHYRNPLNMTDDVIAGVRKEVSKVENATKNASLYLQVNHVPAHDYKKETVDAMVNALEDDLNTSLALTQVLDQVKVLNQVMRVREKDNDVIATEYATLVKMGDVLGFLFEGTKLSEEDIALYEEWNAYKKEKNFDEADRVRKELTERGIL
jgi:cysteinyl-tRNA synthetase